MHSTNDLVSFCTTCDGGAKPTLTTCPTCGDVTNDDTAKILETISWDETPPGSARSDKLKPGEKSKIPTRINNLNKTNPFAPDEICIRSGSSSKSSPRATSGQLEETVPASTVRDRLQRLSPRAPVTVQKSSPKTPVTPHKNRYKEPPPLLQKNENGLISPPSAVVVVEADNVESVPVDRLNSTGEMLHEDPIKQCHIDPDESAAGDDDIDAFFKKLELIPPSVCAKCEQARQVDESTATEFCRCVLDARARLLETLLTDSDTDDDDGYTDQETSHFGVNNRGRRPSLFDEDTQVLKASSVMYKRHLLVIHNIQDVF